jgi:hypothetical protein
MDHGLKYKMKMEEEGDNYYFSTGKEKQSLPYEVPPVQPKFFEKMRKFTVKY